MMRTLLCISVMVLIFSIDKAVHGQLSSTFYDESCPAAQLIVKAAVNLAVAQDERMGASLLDFISTTALLMLESRNIKGCDGSVLLDDSSTITGEKTAGPNANSLRGFDVIDNIKNLVEVACEGVVSCADILAIAARDSVVELGGPTWTVLLGRRDSTTASLSAANTNLPSPASSLSTLISAFQAHGLSTKDLVALSGGHTIGHGRCTTFRARIYSDSNIDASFANYVKGSCPSTGGNNTLFPVDVATPYSFDNNYYSNLMGQKGLFHSDQELFNGGSTNSQVTSYSSAQDTFFTDFAEAMVKMGNISPLTGTSGQIRKNCRTPN